MSATAEPQHWTPIRQNRAAAALHEALSTATAALAEDRGAPWALIAKLLEQHGPHHPPVSSLFATLNGQPVCRGCERAQRTPTRDPTWPCRTYMTLAEELLPLEEIQLRLPQDPGALLYVLDEYRTPTQDAGRHRSDGGVDAGSGGRRRVSLQLTAEPASADGTRGQQ